jgi:O-antigen/teichoic acid export membrane protein
VKESGTELSNSSFRPALLLTGGRTIASAFTFMIPVVLARRLPPAEFGAYKQLFLVYLTFYTLTQIGMAESLYYFLPLQPDRAGRLVANALSVLSASALACVAVFTLARTPIARVVGNASLTPYVPLLGLFLGLMLLTSALEITMIARQRYRWACASYVGTDVVRALLLIGPALAGAGVRGLLWGAIASAVPRIAVATVYLRGEFPGTLAVDHELRRRQFAYALPFALAVLIELLQATLHQYVVSNRFDVATFAIYSVGCLQIPIVDLLAGPAGSVMMVRLAEARRRGDDAGFEAAFRETTRKLGLFFFPLFGLLMVAAHDLIVALFTNTYAAAVPIFRIWCLSVLLVILQTDGLMRALAETRYLVVVNVVRLVLIAALVGPLLTTQGLPGPVVATLLALLVAKIMMLARYRTRLRVRFAELLPWTGLLRIGTAAAGAAVAALVVSATVVAVPIVRLGAIGTAYVVAYAVLLLIGGGITEAERRELAFWRSAAPVCEELTHA